MAATRRSSGPVLRSLSPSGRFYSSSSSSAFASSTSSSFSSHLIHSHHQNHHHHHRGASPTRVSLSSFNRFTLADRPTSPNRSVSLSTAVPRREKAPPQGQKRTCMCSPTNHPGSFRCSLHKGFGSGPTRQQQQAGGVYQSNRLYARRSAMTNSLVRIGTVEGDLVKRALAALIRPSSHSQRRRADFQPRKSRLSVMSKAEGLE